MKQYEKGKASDVDPLSMANPIQVTITTQNAGVKVCMRNRFQRRKVQIYLDKRQYQPQM
jgi:hypothetical protein